MAVRKQTPAKKAPVKTPPKSAAKSSARPPPKAALKAKPGSAPMTLSATMAVLEKAGSAQTKKTYLRHGAREPLFGVSFATLKDLRKRIGTDHELACALWDTGNFDAKNLAVKVVDPTKMTEAQLDAWARGNTVRMCHAYVAAVAAEGPHATSRVEAWLRSNDESERATGWSLVGMLAMRDETLPDAWFLARLAEIEKTIHAAPAAARATWLQGIISIGCRNAALRKAAVSAAKKIGPVEVDHGDTACKTPEVAETLEKTWAHSTSKGFASPAAHERSRESMRLRC